MSDHRYTAIFGGAVVTAGLATFAVYRILGAAAMPRHEPVRTVVVAVRDVPAGVPVPREALGIASWPVRVAPPESFALADSVVGRVTRVPLMPGEPVLVNRLAVRGAAPGLEGAIDPARRAMAVRVNEAASVSGLVQANSRVDVLVASRAEGNLQPVGRVLMSDVRVLGVGSVRPPEPQPGGTAGPPPSNVTASIVTLEVTPAQAEQLAAAEGQGAIQVVLRGYGSVATEPEPTVANASGRSLAWPEGEAGRATPRSIGPIGRMSAGTPSRAATPVRTARRTQPADDTTRSALARPESSVVHVYRGSTLTVLHLEPAAAASAPRAIRTTNVAAGLGIHTP